MVESCPLSAQLALMTLAPLFDGVVDRFGAARCRSRFPDALNASSGMICTFQLTPALRFRCCRRRAISPAVTVPWPLPSIGLSLLLTKFHPIRSSG